MGVKGGSNAGVKKQHYDVVVVGAGLAGLTTAYFIKKHQPKLSICIIERSGQAGGLTGNWIDHRFGDDKKLQTPMHMVFRDKYPNLVRVVEEIGGLLSPVNDKYTIITSDGKRNTMEMNDWTSRLLPPPLHALGMFAKLKLPMLSKWDLFKLGCVAVYCSKQLIDAAARGECLQEPELVPNTMSLEGLELLLGMRKRSRDFIESVTPSIYNFHPWYTSGPRMSNIVAGTMMMNRNSLHYQVFGKSYNAAYIDTFVEKLTTMGVEFKFWTEVRSLDCDASGKKVDSLWYRENGPESENSERYVCDNCGAENYAGDRAFCTRCGTDTTLDFIRNGVIKRPVGSALWKDPVSTGCEQMHFERLVTAIYPHMIAQLIPEGSPLRQHPYVRSFFSSRSGLTELSIGRVYYKEQVTGGERFITGTHNPTFVFNGCQSVYNNFGGEDLGWDGDVIDVLLDVGVLQRARNHEYYIERIVEDLHKVYKDADPSLVEHVSFAKINPSVLYLSEQPAIAGLHRVFNTHRTGAENWYVAGCHSGLIGIGMESATESGMSTVNCILEDMGAEERVTVIPYKIHTGSRIASHIGKWILYLKGARRYPRLAQSN